MTILTELENGFVSCYLFSSLFTKFSEILLNNFYISKSISINAFLQKALTWRTNTIRI